MQQVVRRRRARPPRRSMLNPLLKLAQRLNSPIDTQAFLAVAAVLLVLEAGLCAYIIRRVPYTEIDYTTYLQQVDAYEQGVRNYRNIGGDTGPLVYPAGHLYIYSNLRRLVGPSIEAAQVVFAALYVATQAVVMLIYTQSRTLPPWSLVLLCLSRRLHSIYVLRLFNDCWAMFFAYCGCALLQRRVWVLAVCLFSLAVSVKMNVLLMAPGVLAAMIKVASPGDLVASVAAGGALQVALGAPFLLHNASSYLAKAFELSRVFLHKWTVNWAFVPEQLFTSPRFGLLLLALHLRLLIFLLRKQWFPGTSLPEALRAFLRRQPGSASDPRTTADSIAFMVFSANLVGVLFSRTLHYQFYSWYFHTLPFLLLRSSCAAWQAIPLLLGIEAIWNLYPPSTASSLVLLTLHAAVAGFVLVGSAPQNPQPVKAKQAKVSAS